MKTLLELLSEEIQTEFARNGYDRKYGKVNLSNRPDLCEYQCNGAMAAAKEYKKAPIVIANEIAAGLGNSKSFAEITAVMPGFLNMKLKEGFLTDYLNQMKDSCQYGVEKAENPMSIVIDYGGPNVAKPLHVGHLRSAIIGESVKRIAKFMGHKVIGDIHLGDWGLQMGLIITELKKRQPELPYFDMGFVGEYPSEAPFTISELEEIYPTASNKSKEDPAYKEEAMEATFELQNKNPGYTAIWKHIMRVSVADLKKNYKNLNVDFDLWKGEADAQEYIPDMILKMKKGNFLYESEGALVVDVKTPEDTKEIPPCMIQKSDGASLYTTTDLATIVQRVADMNPDMIIYVVDKRQELHFEQVFRCARKTGLVSENVKLTFLGFGTMNGKDGKPFKTREGGVMRLENLISSINEEMYQKIIQNRDNVSTLDARNTAQVVALSAVKYGDLSNQASKDYVFDVERFTSFEGDTGPYILYTIVRIKSILTKYEESGKSLQGLQLYDAASSNEKELMIELSKYTGIIGNAFEECAPHKICAYIYDLANAFNHFYHETKIMSEDDMKRQAGLIALLVLTRDILETCIDLLGFEAPERM